jgi:SAM-dependent methyltransferase
MSWRLKLLAKLLLARLPLPYRLWKRLGMFVHGDMDEPARAYEVCRRHLEAAGGVKGKVLLELGPGDSLFSALIARSLGAARTYQVDAGDFATRDVAAYRGMLGYLGTPAREETLEAILSAAGSTYLTGGLGSLRTIPSGSVDFVWSHTVLQHVPLDQFEDLVRETRRVLKEDGACSHEIDLRDMLGGRLENLRFSDRVWESRLFRSSGFYANRLRRGELLALFRRCGFEAEEVSTARFGSLPTPRAAMAPRFRELGDEELLVSGLRVVLRPRRGGS